MRRRGSLSHLLLPLLIAALPCATPAQLPVPDADGDGIEDLVDNCDRTPNPGQSDADASGVGDACDCGDATGDGLVDLTDRTVLARCGAALATCGPPCDVTGEGDCDAGDVLPLRRYLTGETSRMDLVCPEQRPESDIPPQTSDAEDPPVIDFDPLPPGSVRDDPSVFRVGDLSQDPGPDPRLPLLGGTLANSGAELTFRGTGAPPTGSAAVAQDLLGSIIEGPGGRYAEVILGGFVVRVLADGAPPRVTDPPADVELNAPGFALEDLLLVKTFELGSVGGATAISVSGLQLQEATSGAALDEQQDLDLGYLPEACDEKAVIEFSKTGALDPGMPPVHFPEISGCSDDQCVLALHGWISAHHNAWRAQQMIDFSAAQDGYYRSFIWGQPGRRQNGLEVTIESSPEYWFGDHATYRFWAVDNGIGKLRDMFESLRTGGLEIELYCPDAGSDPTNVCFSHPDVPAHHWVRSDIALCNEFFLTEDGDGDPVTYWYRAHTLTHELMHHRDIDFEKGGVNLVRAVMDRHIHGHGNACVANVSTIAFYGESNVRHLATYENLQTGHCKHRDKDFGNNDTWAFFVTRVGDLVHRDIMWTWPAPAQPTPEPPECQQVGVEACQCADTLDFGEGSDPDGDYRSDRYCPDDDTELSCVRTKFNASDTVGICVDCEQLRGPGCECDAGRPCQLGSCFGDDTFGGGVGHCYRDPPPNWACLADCERLFNDPGAYCYHDALGGARCYDGGCSEPEAEACIQQGLVCRESACVDECDDAQDCAGLGYPPTFICAANRCQFPF